MAVTINDDLIASLTIDKAGYAGMIVTDTLGNFAKNLETGVYLGTVLDEDDEGEIYSIEFMTNPRGIYSVRFLNK